MKISEVSIGMKCWTLIGQVRHEVEVLRFVDGYPTTRVQVRRVGEVKPLPKPRTCAALHHNKWGD